MDKETTAEFFRPYVEAFKILNLKFEVFNEENLWFRVTRDSICQAFPYIAEHKVYDLCAHEIGDYLLEPFFWDNRDDEYMYGHVWMYGEDE